MPWRKDRKVYSFFSTNRKNIENGEIIVYRIKCIDSMRFMTTLIWRLSENLADRLHNSKWKDFKSCLAYIKVKDVAWSGSDFEYVKKFWKDFELKNLDDYCDLLSVICYLLLLEY